eukprot:4429362-Pyramimonas_sp.AAC.1
MGFTQDNITRFGKVGAVARSLQLPWCIIGDFNIDVRTMARSQLLHKIEGHIIESSLEYTCV